MATETSKATETTLSRYFRGYVENVFMNELGFCYPMVTDYLSELLVAYMHMDRANQLRDGLGAPIDQVATILQQAIIDGDDVLDDAQKYAIYRHIGDFCLFWAGLFPEHIFQEGGAASIPLFCQQGAHAYEMAYDLSGGDSPEDDVLLFLASEFQACVYGLQEVCKDWRRDSSQANGGPIMI